MEEIRSPRMSCLSKLFHLAVTSGRVDMVKFLLWAGAKVNARDSQKRTPLHRACELNNENMVVTLLRNGAKLDQVDDSGMTPLHFTLDFHQDNAIISPLVNALLCVNVASGSKERSLQWTYHTEDEEIMNMVNLKDNYRATSLHLASMRNNKHVVCSLLRVGAQVGGRDRQGLTALHYACLYCAVDVVDVLVNHGEDINTKDYQGNTPLHLVYYTRPFEIPLRHTFTIIETLLSKGAKIQEKNDDLKTPYETVYKSLTNTWLSYGEDFKGSFEEIKLIEEIFIKHVVKTKTLNTQVEFDISWKLGKYFYHYIKYRCGQELEEMKSCNILKNISMYEVFSQSLPPYLLSSPDLLYIDAFLCSPDLLTRFPLYCHTLRTVFERLKLMSLALRSFYSRWRKKMVKELPCDVATQLLAYLNNVDLMNFVRSGQ